MNNPLTKKQLREKIAKVMSDWGVDFYEGNLIHREEQRLSIIRGFQDAMIDIILEDRKAYAEYVIGKDVPIRSHTYHGKTRDELDNYLRSIQRKRNQGEKTDE